VAEFSYGRHFYLANVFFKNFALNDAELHYEMAERLRVQDGGWGGATIPTWQAQLFAFEGRYAKAEERFTVARAIEVHEQVPGVAQSNWVVCQLANYLTDTSRPRESLALTKEVLSKSPVIPEGKPSPHSLWAKGKALIRIGHVEEGLQFVTQAKSIASAADDKLAEIHITYDHIQALLELGRLVDAEVLLGAELELLQAGEFERNSDSRPYWRFVVTMATLQLNSVKARAFFEQSRDVLIPNGVGNLELSMFDSLAASIEQLEQKPDLALRRTELALDRIANSPDQLLLREWQAKHEELRGISLAALGRPAEAQRSFQTALEVNKAIFDPNTSISVGRVALRLAMLHKAAGRTGIAKTYQAQADAIRRTHPMFEQWIL
jgi:tetratricopeptide (TPR) repeat protein